MIRASAFVAFLLPSFYLYFGAYFLTLAVLFSFFVVISVVNSRTLVPLSIAVIGFGAVILETIYRARANDDDIFSLAITALGTIFLVYAVRIAKPLSVNLNWYLYGNIALLAIVLASKLFGFSLVSADYSLGANRIVGAGVKDPNAFALIHVAFIFPLLLIENMSLKAKVCVLIILLSIPIYSLSRTALILIVALMLLGFPLFLRQSAMQRGFLWLVLAFGAFSIIPFVELTEGRVGFIESLSSKFSYILYAWETIQNELTFFGVEDNSHLKLYQVHHVVKPSYHNTYLSILASSGILGFVFLIASLAFLLSLFPQRLKLPVFLIVNSVFLTTGYLYSLSFFIMLALGAGFDKTKTS